MDKEIKQPKLHKQTLLDFLEGLIYYSGYLDEEYKKGLENTQEYIKEHKGEYITGNKAAGILVDLPQTIRNFMAWYQEGGIK